MNKNSRHFGVNYVLKSLRSKRTPCQLLELRSINYLTTSLTLVLNLHCICTVEYSTSGPDLGGWATASLSQLVGAMSRNLGELVRTGGGRDATSIAWGGRGRVSEGVRWRTRVAVPVPVLVPVPVSPSPVDALLRWRPGVSVLWKVAARVPGGSWCNYSPISSFPYPYISYKFSPYHIPLLQTLKLILPLWSSRRRRELKKIQKTVGWVLKWAQPKHKRNIIKKNTQNY